MDGIILAGGAGTRMHPLTLHCPKPLLPLQNRPILEWSLLSLRGVVERVLVVVHYLREQIAAYMAQQRIFPQYALVAQLPQPMGTGHALRCCQPALQSADFLVINGDDLYSRAALQGLSQRRYGILTTPREDYARYGVVLRDAQGGLQRIDEKPPPGRYRPPAACSIGAYKLNSAVFQHVAAPSVRGEIEISDIVTALAAQQRVDVLESPFWLPIGDPAAFAAAQTTDIQRWIL